MSEPSVTLPVQCRQCKKPVTLHVMDWPLGSPVGPSLRPSIWTCPNCGETNKGRLPGRLVGLNQFMMDSKRK